MNTSKKALAQAIEYLEEWSTAQAHNGPITQEQLDGMIMTINELERFAAGGTWSSTDDYYNPPIRS